MTRISPCQQTGHEVFANRDKKIKFDEFHLTLFNQIDHSNSANITSLNLPIPKKNLSKQASADSTLVTASESNAEAE
ncbi:MAG: hypothetical protein CR974_02305 [Gammaproteobacteria bacterium]|nr:MAG: hypothetical protein CR974_02305 [Gammaproteobacteria bacterium]